MCTNQGKRAFTLVELLVVIGIIAVLIGILLPALGRARAQAKLVACQANLRQIGQAVQMYVGNNKGVLPIGDWEGAAWSYSATGATQISTTSTDRATRWHLLLKRTLNPKYSETWTGSAITGGDVAKLQELFQCPDAPGDNDKFRSLSSANVSYMSHPLLMPGINGNMTSTTPRLVVKPYRIAKIKRSAEIALVFDAPLCFEIGTVNGQQVGYWHPRWEVVVAQHIDNGGWWRPPYLFDEYGGTTVNPNDSIDMTPINFNPSDPRAPTNKDLLNNTCTIRFRHLKDTVANALMVDGHVESFHYNPRKPSNDKTVTDFLRKNIYVNRP